MLSKLKKGMAAVLCLVLFISSGSIAFASGGGSVSKDENVFIILNPDGSIQKQIVSDWLHSDDGLRNVSDVSNLKDIKNIKSDSVPDSNGEQLRWDTTETDLYYQGISEQTPPITVQIEYRLDGKAVTAQELLGKSGKLEITIRLTNHEKKIRMIDGQRKEVYTPFAVAIVCDLPNNNFKNIDAGGSTVLTESTNQIVSFLAFPGLKESFSGILDDQLKELKEELQDEFTIQTEVTDFKMPTFLFAVATNLGDLKEVSTLPEVDELFDGLDQLQEATEQLTSGTRLLAEAAVQFDKKMGEFKGAYQTFDDGVVKAYGGAKQLSDGTADLKQATDLLKSKISTELVPAIENSQPLQQQLTQKMSELETQLSGLEIPDMTVLQTKLGAAIGDVCDTSMETAVQIATGNTIDALTPEQQAQITYAKQQIKAQASQQISQMMSSLDLEALTSLQSTLLDIKSLSGQMLGSMNALLNALYNPQDDISNPKTIATAILALSVGADKLAGGADDLLAGLGDLNGASKTISGAIGEFDSATGQLASSTSELKDGMETYAEEGVGKLLDDELIGGFKTALEIKDAMEEQADAYTSYTGLAEGMDGTVRFVMKTDGIEETAKEEEAVAEQPEKVGFWKRVVNLFRDVFQKK